jgi:hemerythrin-like domain-containing protein
MSGPALKQWDSHSSIHEAALGEAMELTELLRQCVAHDDLNKATEIAYITVEHWESRTLRHAESEEEGLYVELVDANPEMQRTIATLTRDHDLLRKIVNEIKDLLGKGGEFVEVLKRLDALIVVDQLHNQDEGRLLQRTGVAER